MANRKPPTASDSSSPLSINRRQMLARARSNATDAATVLGTLSSFAGIATLDEERRDIVIRILPKLANALDDYDALQPCRPSLKPNGAHFRALKLLSEIQTEIQIGTSDEMFSDFDWTQLRQRVNEVIPNGIGNLADDILSEHDEAVERLGLFVPLPPEENNPKADLKSWAGQNLGVKQRRLVEILCDCESISLAKLALDPVLEWTDVCSVDDALNGLRTAIKTKLVEQGFEIGRKSNSVFLRTLEIR